MPVYITDKIEICSDDSIEKVLMKKTLMKKILKKKILMKKIEYITCLAFNASNENTISKFKAFQAILSDS